MARHLVGIEKKKSRTILGSQVDSYLGSGGRCFAIPLQKRLTLLSWPMFGPNISVIADLKLLTDPYDGPFFNSLARKLNTSGIPAARLSICLT